jgi:dihydrofolate synthase/folylpolyglutamate synthase
MNNYQEALNYLYEQLPMFQRMGKAAIRKMDLSNTLQLCEALGQPQAAFPCVHIAGTNGKGSTAHLLSAIFQAAGYKVGLYTSPHYKDFRERIKVNGQPIVEEAVLSFVQVHRPLFESLHLSFFEMTVGMAFHYFKEQAVDIAFIEVGLGGRLDSTNVILPQLSIITSIGFDHQDILGHTLPMIAREKAGIIKPRVPVLIGENKPETRPVFYGEALRKGAPLRFAEDFCRAEILDRDAFHAQYNIRDAQGQLWLSALDLGLHGIYQQQNLQTVLAAVLWLRAEYGWQIAEQAIRQGCAQVQQLTQMLGRWQILGQDPLIICDAAHNEHGLRPVIKDLLMLPHAQLHFVLGMVKDKDPSMVLALLPKQATYYFCKADIPRGLPAEDLQAQALRYGLRGEAFATVQAAFLAAKRRAQPQDLIFVGGSIFVVGEIL